MSEVKIEQHWLAVGTDQNVRGLNIAMHHTLVVGVLEALCQARHDPGRGLDVAVAFEQIQRPNRIFGFCRRGRTTCGLCCLFVSLAPCLVSLSGNSLRADRGQSLNKLFPARGSGTLAPQHL